MRELPTRVANLESIGIAETPIELEGADVYFARAEEWFREEGFLPLAQPRNSVAAWAGLDKPLIHSQSDNELRLARLRAPFELLSTVPNASDGGQHEIPFRKPHPVDGTRELRLCFTMARDTSRPVVHTHVLPGTDISGTSSYESKAGRGHGIKGTGGFGFGAGGDFPLDGGPGMAILGFQGVSDHGLTRAGWDDQASGYDQLMASRGGSGRFTVPVLFGLDLYEGTATHPWFGSPPRRTPAPRLTGARRPPRRRPPRRLQRTDGGLSPCSFRSTAPGRPAPERRPGVRTLSSAPSSRTAGRPTTDGGSDWWTSRGSRCPV